MSTFHKACRSPVTWPWLNTLTCRGQPSTIFQFNGVPGLVSKILWPDPFHIIIISFHWCPPSQPCRRTIKFNLVGAFLSVWPCLLGLTPWLRNRSTGNWSRPSRLSISDRSSRWWRAEDSERPWKRPRVRVGPWYKSRHCTMNLA